VTQALQILTIIGVALGLAWYGLWRDRRDDSDPRQRSIVFPDESESTQDKQDRSQHAAMARLS